MEYTEKKFERDIESYLITEGGYIRGTQATYDKAKAIDMHLLLTFVRNTQPNEWERYEKVYQEKATQMLYKRFNEEVDSKGLIHVLRNGVKDRGIAIRFVYFEPSSELNQDLIDNYNNNILTCTRQFSYSSDNHNTIDMVLSLNGIPIVAIELKNQITGQSVEQGKLQFVNDRDPRELIFNFNKRVLVYFVADLYDVYMTTKLDRGDTLFLPFNQGSNGAGNVGGAGNPANQDGYVTSYLWERVFNRDSLLALLQRYISVEKDKKGKAVKIIFPRYHQLDVVEKLIADIQNRDKGRNYLIQHSAGSGKSNSIAWLSYRLASLHNALQESVFDTVFVVTDRRLLNRQLQDTIAGFDHKVGLIVTITDNDPSTALRDAINDKKKIIICTLHRFPIIYQEIDKQKGRYAIIVDEAHSSQTGTSAKKLKQALADTTQALEEYSEIEAKSEAEIIDGEDYLVREILSHGKHDNLSFFAFTATPKPKTLEMFGDKQEDGTFRAFHIYSMRQAIEEVFILDVLKYYVTVENAYKVAKSISDNPEMEENPTTRAIISYQKSHDVTMYSKVEMMIDKFKEVTLTKLEGKAKAMLVTPSRAHAVKYYQIIKEYIKSKGYHEVKPLVAFSGTVKIGDIEYTEVGLNSQDGVKISEAQLREYFATDDYNLLVVAEKYQTGFDEPRLHTMFVDKKLNSVKAVQTLSRVNRVYKGKIDTFILDFVNSTEDITDSFKPYYEETMLEKEIDVNLVYKIKDKIDSFYLWNEEDIDKFVAEYSKGDHSEKAMGKISSLLKGASSRYNELSEENRLEAKDAIKSFNRCYSYVVQITRMFDKDLHKYYLFSEYFSRFIPRNSIDRVLVEEKVQLINNELRETFSGSIELKPKTEEKILKPQGDGKSKLSEKKKDLLENIIEKINMMYEGKFAENDRVIIETIYDKMQSRCKKLSRQAKNTDVDMFSQAIFPEEFEKVAQECYVEHIDSFTKLFENKDYYVKVMEQMARGFYLMFRNMKDKE